MPNYVGLHKNTGFSPLVAVRDATVPCNGGNLWNQRDRITSAEMVPYNRRPGVYLCLGAKSVPTIHSIWRDWHRLQC
jgi:hypothetical protein